MTLGRKGVYLSKNGKRKLLSALTDTLRRTVCCLWVELNPKWRAQALPAISFACSSRSLHSLLLLE